MPDQTAKAFRVQKLAPAERFRSRAIWDSVVHTNRSHHRCCCICYSSRTTLVRARSFRDAQAPVRVITQRSNHVGTKDRASDRAQDAKGRVKEAAGSVTGNRDLKNKGKTDQAKAGMKNTEEDLKDVAHKVKDAVTR